MPAPIVFAPLVAWLGSLVSGFFAMIVAYFGKKAAIAIAVIAVWIALLTAFTLSINALIDGLYVSMPVGILQAGMSMLPSNTGECVAAIASAHLAAWVYTSQIKAVVLKLRA